MLSEDQLESLAQRIGKHMATEVVRQLRDSKPAVAQEYLSPEDAAQVCGLTIKALERLRQKRQGPKYRKLGRTVRYHVDDVRAWIDAGAVRS